MTSENLIDNLRFSDSQNASSVLANKISGMIISKKIPPGYVFPSENVFCEQLRIGRSTLREAYMILETTGFISRTKRGTFVNDYAKIEQAMPLETRIKTSEFNDILEFRVMLECGLSYLAAERADAENIGNLQKSLEGMKASKDIKELTYYDTLFHLEIAKASKNKLLYGTMLSVSNTFSNFVYNAFQIESDDNKKEAIAYHEAILDAVTSKDSKLAQKLMKKHVNSVYKRISHGTAT